MKYQISMDTANATLQNVLTACNQSPNAIPFAKIVQTQKVNTRIYGKLISLASLLLLFTFLLPVYILPLSDITTDFFAPKPVTLVHHYLEEDVLYLEFNGDNIVYQQAYMVTEDGEKHFPLSYDEHKKNMSFTYFSGQEILFHIPVRDANEVQLLLTPVYE